MHDAIPCTSFYKNFRFILEEREVFPAFTGKITAFLA
jgi:hypothetical protein